VLVEVWLGVAVLVDVGVEVWLGVTELVLV
jgi:hypothetical protein